MIDVALLLLVAAVCFGIRRLLHVPLIPLLLLSGMGIRYGGLAMSEDTARSALDIGLAVLVFGAGMELNPKRFTGQHKPVLVIGLLQFFCIGIGGAVIAWLTGLDVLPALYIGLAISTSSTLIIIRLLKGRHQMFEPFGRLVTGVLLLQDLLIIISIVVLIRIPDGGAAVLRGLGGLSVLLALAGVSYRYVMPYVVLRAKIDHETLGLTMLTVLFLFMGVAHLLQLPIITGAFLAGVSVSSFPINSIARGQLGSVTAFFMALFFIVLGSQIDWPTVAEWKLALWLTLFILVGTPLLVVLVASRLNITARSAIESGLLLAMTSEFSLVVVLQGILLGQLPGEVFTVVAMVTVLTMTITPLLATDRVTWRLMNWLPGTSPSAWPDAKELRDHVVMLGYGKGSSVVFKALKEAGREVVIVNDDPVVVQDLQRQNIYAVYGDGSDARVLEIVQAHRARLIISSMRRVADAENVLNRLGPDGPAFLIRVFDPSEARQIEALGGTPILSSEAAAEAFMKWHQQLFGAAGSERAE